MDRKECWTITNKNRGPHLGPHASRVLLPVAHDLGAHASSVLPPATNKSKRANKDRKGPSPALSLSHDQPYNPSTGTSVVRLHKSGQGAPAGLFSIVSIPHVPALDCDDITALPRLHNSRRNPVTFNHEVSAVPALHNSASLPSWRNRENRAEHPRTNGSHGPEDGATFNHPRPIISTPALSTLPLVRHCTSVATAPMAKRGTPLPIDGLSDVVSMALKNPSISVLAVLRQPTNERCALAPGHSWASLVKTPLIILYGTAVTAVVWTDQMARVGLTIQVEEQSRKRQELKLEKNAASAVNGAKNSASSATANKPNCEFAPGRQWVPKHGKHATEKSVNNSGNSGLDSVISSSPQRANPTDPKGAKMKAAFVLCTVLAVIMTVEGFTRPIPEEDVKMEARTVVPLKAHPFDLQQVRLLDGPFRDAMLRDKQYLLSLDPDRLLHTYRITAGLTSSAKPLGGWEAPDVELRGHTLGHYLSACSLMYASTGDAELKTRAENIVVELDKIQRAMPARGFHQGYLSAFPEEFFDRLDARQKVWAPYYTLHKIMAGLLDVYTICHDQLALDVLVKLADWVGFRVGRLTEQQQQRDMETEFGGMNEVLANLYAATAKPEYLALARTFDHKALFDPLSRGQDPLDNLHANTQIPKMIGAAREYELTGDKRYYDIASFFWQRVAHYRSFVIGGNSDDEAFFPVESFSMHLSADSTETCNTYNMLKLTRHLFAWSPSAETMDFYERGLFNQILASQDPATGMMCYYVPLKPGAYKSFSTPEDSFWCCVGTGMENHGKYGDSIYFHDDDSLYLNLFIASELNWKAKGLTVRQETHFPDEDSTRLTIKCEKPVRLALKIRYPSWAVSGMNLMINGKQESVQAQPGSYATVDREWKDGDTVQIRLPMTLHMEAMPDDPKTVAFLYGPIVLAGDLGAEGMENVKRYGPSVPEMGRLKPVQIPALVSDPKGVLAGIRPVKGAPMTFQTTGIGRPADLTLKPFYKVVESRYSVYWKIYSPVEWDRKKAETVASEAHRKELERRTVDWIAIGDDKSEVDHGFQGESTDAGDFYDRRWRAARGWFSYNLKIVPGKPVTLACTYRGSEGHAREFDLLVDGEKIASQSMQNHPGEFFDFEYPLPESLTQGKQLITVRFQAHPDVMTGSVFDVRTVQ
jgi:DUF1680 family protein